MKIPDITTQVRLKAELTLSGSRLGHVRRVAELTAELCRRFGIDVARGELAAWAHDLAREWPHDQLLVWATRRRCTPTDFELGRPKLLHGFAAAALLESDWGVDDTELLNAVRHHTLGRPGMSDLEMVLYAADYLEPGRDFLSDSLRSVVAGDSLEIMVTAVVEHMMARGFDIADTTREMYDELMERIDT